MFYYELSGIRYSQGSFRNLVINKDLYQKISYDLMNFIILPAIEEVGSLRV